MDFVIGGLAGAGATVFTNPLDVVKTRLQLQGELKTKVETTKRYRGTFHGIYVIAKNDGAVALQKGLAPAMVAAFFVNSVRLGLYHVAEVRGWTKSKEGDIIVYKTLLWGSIGGALSALCASPMTMLKTRLQAASHPSIAVGRQHRYNGVVDGLVTVYKTEGLRAYYAGADAACARMFIGSGVQLSTFSIVKEALVKHDICTNSPLGLSFIASAASGLTTALINCPLDMTTVRLYNQGSGLKEDVLYKGVLDCLRKVYNKEGLHGLYKGVLPFYLRVAPQTTICLSIWDMLNNLYFNYKNKKYR